MSGRETRDREQAERAEQAWELLLLDAPDDETMAVLRRVLRIKRFEVEQMRARLPGRLRRGAHADLAPLEATLTEAGIRCELRRREQGGGPSS